MKRDSEIHGSYVEKVRQDTRRYVQELLRENGQLRALVACLESEKKSLARDRQDLEDHLASARRAVERHKHEKEELRQKLVDVEAENQRFAEQYSEVEVQNNNLANLYVASYRLHGTLDRSEVLEAVKEIVINLVGSEELAILEMSLEGERLRLVDSFGLEPGNYEEVPLGTGIIGQVAQSGETYLAGGPGNGSGLPGEENLTACIPLRIDDRVSGVVAIFRLLPQKTRGLEALDYELFDLLATQAGTALYSTTLHTAEPPRSAGPRESAPPQESQTAS